MIKGNFLVNQVASAFHAPHTFHYNVPACGTFEFVSAVSLSCHLS